MKRTNPACSALFAIVLVLGGWTSARAQGEITLLAVGPMRSWSRDTSDCSTADERSSAVGRAGGRGTTGARTPEVDADANHVAIASADTPNQTTRRTFMVMARIVARPSGDCVTIRRAPCIDWSCGRFYSPARNRRRHSRSIRLYALPRQTAR